MTSQETPAARETPAAQERKALLALKAVPAHRTRRYGPHPPQLIDYYLPRGAERGRLTVLHGGFWREEFDRAHLTPLAAELAEQGWAVALVEFRRVGGDGGWPEIFDDVAAGVDTAWDGGEQLLAGHSSGGHLALWAANRAVLPRHSRWWRPDTRVSGVVAIAPVADLAYGYELELGASAVAELLGDPEQVAARLAETDPMQLLPAQAPAVLVHGSNDVVVPVEVSRRYAAASGATLREVSGVGHFAPVTPGTDAFQALLAALAGFDPPLGAGQ